MRNGDLVWVYSLDEYFVLKPDSRHMMKVLDKDISYNMVTVQINPRWEGSDYMTVYSDQIQTPTKGELMLYKLES